MGNMKVVFFRIGVDGAWWRVAFATASSVQALRTVQERWIRAPRRNDGAEHVSDKRLAIRLPQMM
jgi:hypothetical protein